MLRLPFDIKVSFENIIVRQMNMKFVIILN